MKVDTILLPSVLSMLGFSGLSPYNRKWINRFCTYFWIPVTISLSVLSILDPFVTRGGVEDLVLSLEGIGVTHQVSVKALLYPFIRADIEKLLNKAESFWPIDKFGERLQRKQQRSQRIIGYGLRAMLIVTGVSVVIGMTKFLFERELPYMNFRTLIHDDRFFFSVYAVQFVEAVVHTPFVIGYDFLFLTLVNIGKCQLIMIRHSFGRLCRGRATTERELAERQAEMRSYVAHHVVILNYLEDLKNIYSLSLLNQFAASYFSMTASLYFMMSQGVSPNNVRTTSKCISMIVTYSLQLFVLCVTGTHISTASEKVGEGFYDSGWESFGSKQIRDVGTLVIQRSQRPVVFTAGGYYDLSLQMFTAMFMSASSLFTFMKKIKEKNAE